MLIYVCAHDCFVNIAQYAKLRFFFKAVLSNLPLIWWDKVKCERGKESEEDILQMWAKAQPGHLFS